MKVLFWIPPWGSQGNPLFYQNCVRKHLIPQANSLRSSGLNVHIVLPELLDAEIGLIDRRIEVIRLPMVTQLGLTGSLSDPSKSLYMGSDAELVERITKGLEPLFSTKYDAILLWETPVPFLEILFPEALIVHQMPGFFSKPPYPHTVIFDPVGLFKRGSFHLCAEDIISSDPHPEDLALAREFAGYVRRSVNALRSFELRDLDPDGRFSKLSLLPLQVSRHYSFQGDAEYENQGDFLLDILHGSASDTGVVVTQYMTPHASDAALNGANAEALSKKFPNLLYNPIFDTIPSVSQYLLPLIDEVVTCSSSLGLQSLAWEKELRVVKPTCFSSYDSEINRLSGRQWSDVCAKTLAFVLGRHQPLASVALGESSVLTGLLEEMVHRKRSGIKGKDLLPRLAEIDPQYSSRLLDGFRPEPAARALKAKGGRWEAEHSELKKFRRAMNDSSCKIITFDIFDTLLQRPVEKPLDVYKFLDTKALELTGNIACDFPRVREAAEVETREKWTGTKEEISLDDIYDTIAQFYDVNCTVVEELKLAEIEFEVEFSSPRRFGKLLWQEAVASGRPIYLISDMYLPREVIERMLQKSLYSGYRKIFLSMEHGCRKKDGRLYDIVTSELNIEPSSILHIGDNEDTDVNKAESKGIKAMQWVSSIERQRQNPIYKDIYSPRSGVGSRSRSVLAGLTAQSLFDSPTGFKSTHFNGSSFNLGYAALGPMYIGYMLWLGRQAQNDGVSKLYFLAREGWLFKRVYDVLYPDGQTAPPSLYLYTSRRAARVAGLKSRGDVIALASEPFTKGVSLATLMKSRFGINVNEVDGRWMAAAGYMNSTIPLDSDSQGRIQFSKFCGLIAESILTEAEDERDIYLAYLEDIGLFVEQKPAVVDLGWKANIQGALGNLLDRELQGYYYATLQGAEAWTQKGHRHRGYAGDYVVDIYHPSVAVNNRHLLEYLTCHVEPSLVRMSRRSGSYGPVFKDEESPGQRRRFIENVHSGVIQCAADFRAGFSHVQNEVFIDPFIAERVFADFVQQPTPTDAGLLKGCYFEDAVGGVSKKYIVAPDGKGAYERSIWKQGAKAVHDTEDLEGAPKSHPYSGVYRNQVGSGLDGVYSDKLNSVRRWEARLVKSMVSDRKHAKYLRDRDAFFRDSKSDMARAWYKFSLRKEEL